MHNFTVARPYARALFASALQRKQLEPCLERLQLLAVVAMDKKAQALLLNPKITTQQLAKLFIDTVKTAGQQNTKDCEFVDDFIELLADAKRLNVLPDIYILYQRQLSVHNKTVDVEVTSAFELSQQQQQDMETALAKRFKQAVNVNYKIDDGLIGGACIRAGNWVMDGSVKNKISRLSDELLAS